jgi:hypothetical protein
MESTRKWVESKSWPNRIGQTAGNIKNEGGAFTAPYGSNNGSIDTAPGLEGECPWYAGGRFQEVTGIKLPYPRHAKYWLDQYQNTEGVEVIRGGENIREHSVAVNANGTYGHVMFVEHIDYDPNGNPATVYYTEANAWETDYNAQSTVGVYDAGHDGVIKAKSYADFLKDCKPSGYIVAK